MAKDKDFNHGVYTGDYDPNYNIFCHFCGLKLVPSVDNDGVFFNPSTGKKTRQLVIGCPRYGHEYEWHDKWWKEIEGEVEIPV